MVDVSAAEFEQHRRFLTGLAYRMLGSLADAQDVVQDAFLRWHGAALAGIASPRAWLSTTVTRLCLDLMKSARSQRERYVGQWLPEPVIATLASDPTLAVEERIDAPVALMLALERLSPLERAVFILHDLFDIGFGEIAGAIDRNEAACRQLLVRARGHVGEGRRRFEVDPDEAAHVTTAFFAAIGSGDASRLRDLLAEAARMHSDGGGKRIATLNVIHGADRISRFFAGVAQKHGPEAFQAWSGPLWINGLPGYVSADDKGLVQTTALEIENGRIVAIYIMRNPDKLAAAASFLHRA
ncbi:sigma-70 family RNA polymerase sigma factor [Kaistia granuli]|uniref:sigma-70 family RNA polymerase sigma factor n=1 Tax=Kaistia granuli TaxID=363259 RepID=UPI000382AFBC|nr:sigma-70 family RNA polymerase sigma factor [Kaistia granuli]